MDSPSSNEETSSLQIYPNNEETLSLPCKPFLNFSKHQMIEN